MRTAVTYETEEEHRQRFAGPIRDASGFLVGCCGFLQGLIRCEGEGCRVSDFAFKVQHLRFEMTCVGFNVRLYGLYGQGFRGQ